MSDSLYCAVSLESILPDVFPPVPLYMQNNQNFVLYKGQDQPFTSADRARLESSRTDFLFIRQGDMELVTPLLESSLAEAVDSMDLSPAGRGKFIYQTAVNYLSEIYTDQDKMCDAARCRTIAQALLDFVLSDQNVTQAFPAIMGHNYFVFVHSVHVAVISLLVHRMVCPDHDRDHLLAVAVGGLLHDIGMSFIPRSIVDKPHSLKDIEYLKIKKHPVLGYDHLSAFGLYDERSLDIVRLHHERYDGSGYPLLLKKDEIPLSVQITSISDVFSALTMDRPYQRPLAPRDALRMIKEELKLGFDPKLLKSFEAVAMKFPPSS